MWEEKLRAKNKIAPPYGGRKNKDRRCSNNMIPKLQPALYRLPRRMAVLFFITYTVICGLVFVPEPAETHFDPGFEQSYIPETSELGNPAVLSADRQVRVRKKVSYLSPPRQASGQETGPDTLAVHSVMVPRAFSYPVVQQPQNDPYYVSSESGMVTEFGLAREHNNTGLLAHNYIAGKSFKHLKLGQDIYIVRVNGRTERYTVSAIHRFQALDSTKTGSQFVDLESGEILTATEVFTKMYMGAPHLTLQTCIEAKGDASWGRLFVIATPVIEAD